MREVSWNVETAVGLANEKAAADESKIAIVKSRR